MIKNDNVDQRYDIKMKDLLSHHKERLSKIWKNRKNDKKCYLEKKIITRLVSFEY